MEVLNRAGLTATAELAAQQIKRHQKGLAALERINTHLRQNEWIEAVEILQSLTVLELTSLERR